MTTTNTDEHLSSTTLQGDPSDCEAAGIINNDECRLTTQALSDPVFMHLSHNFTIRELVQLKKVSKTIGSLVSINSPITAQVRWEDDTMDWYFPPFWHIESSHEEEEDSEMEEEERKENIIKRCKWAGVHRPSGELHRLPCLWHLLNDHVQFEGDKLEFLVCGGREGLLLFLLDPNHRPWFDEVLDFDSSPERSWNNIVGHVRVYEVDDNVGDVKPSVRYELRKYFPSNLHRNVHDYGFQIMSYKIGLVECIGGIYAIIPATLDVDQEIDREFRPCCNLGPTYLRYIDYGFLPLRFYILRLEGSIGLRFGQLLMQETEDLRNVRLSMKRLEEQFGRHEEFFLNSLEVDQPHETGAWYQCIARGSVI